MIPNILGNVIHSLEENSAHCIYLLRNFIIVTITYIIWNVSSAISEINFEIVNKSIENDIRFFCYENVLKSNISILQRKSEGEIITKVIRDTEKVEKAFSNLFSLSQAIIHSLSLVVIMFWVNEILAFIVVFLFMAVIVILRISSKSLKSLYKKYKKSEESLLKDLKNHISGIFTIRVFSLENKIVNLLRKRNEENLKNHTTINKKVHIIRNLNFFISSMFRVSTVFIGGLLYMIRKINIGQIFKIHTYSIHLANLLRRIIETDIILKDIVTSFNRIIEFIDEFKNEKSECVKRLESISKIEFKDVTFQYNDRKLFSELSFYANKNQIIGIKGQNGTGKTTLTYLICGFYKPEGVYINDVSSKYLNEKRILERVSYVLQDTHLFPVTVMENLTCFGNIPEEKVYEICKMLDIHEKILGFSNGYDTMINEKNLNLSGGEKQLLSIARAMLKDSDVLILDEINSALDVKMEGKILNNLKKYFKDKIVFIISHRERVYNLCDFIIDLDDIKSYDKIGNITEKLQANYNI